MTWSLLQLKIIRVRKILIAIRNTPSNQYVSAIKGIIIMIYMVGGERGQRVELMVVAKTWHAGLWMRGHEHEHERTWSSMSLIVPPSMVLHVVTCAARRRYAHHTPYPHPRPRPGTGKTTKTLTTFWPRMILSFNRYARLGWFGLAHSILRCECGFDSLWLCIVLSIEILRRSEYNWNAAPRNNI